MNEKLIECFEEEQAAGTVTLPSGRVLNGEKEFNPYYEWKNGNKFCGKQFSILGDSISTLEGYNPKGYNLFFTGDVRQKAGVSDMDDTWWGQVINYCGGELLINNSWSGSRVTKLPNRETLFPSGCSDERTNGLHIGIVKPDVIIVYLGTNDWAKGVEPTYGDCVDHHYRIWSSVFETTYDKMLEKLKSNYPNAEIFCCTLCSTYMSGRPSFVFPKNFGGINIEKYNAVIRSVAENKNCRVIDLYKYHMPYDSVDGSHPNRSGMNTLATIMLREILDETGAAFLDCDKEEHNYIVADEFTGGANYVCKKCGKTKTVNTLLERKNEISDSKIEDSEYVMLDPDATTMLYDGTLSLSIVSTDRDLQFRKDVVEVGRDDGCDFTIPQNAISRKHAAFYYEKHMWFLRDNFSTNGTWINGVRIQPGKKYQLAPNDEINFAMAERVFFYKYEQSTQPAGDPAAKALAFLEAGMATFAQSGQKDEVSLKLIIAALSDAPLYFPVKIDLEEKDAKMHILTLTSKDDVEIVPMFTSDEEARKGPSVLFNRFYPQDYLPRLLQMDKPVIINPFSEHRFHLSKHLITDVLMPLVQNKVLSKPPVEHPMEERLVGRTIDGKYTVLKLIGTGGIYTTYLVREVNINKVWAMKACDKKNHHYSPAVREAILTELYMMKKLDHPAIPKVVDIIENEENIFIVRDYIEGETLETIASMYGAQPADKVIEWGKQLCDALRYLHSLMPPLIYRDMKPANIILKPDGTVKIIDFGIMRTYKQNQSSDTCCLGTIGYAAPEQFGGSQSDARTDIFGLGMTMFRLVTGINPIKPPYEIRPICQVNPSLPKGLEYIICKCTQPNPNDRYQSCDELMEDLNKYMSLPKPKPKGIFHKLFGK